VLGSWLRRDLDRWRRRRRRKGWWRRIWIEVKDYGAEGRTLEEVGGDGERGERRGCEIWREREAARLREMGAARVWTRPYRGG
jgi:hypothetical protein